MTEEDSHSVPDVKEGPEASVSVSRKTKMCVLKVVSSVWGRDMGSHSARPQTTACLPNEMLVGHCWSDSVAQGEK